MVGAGDQHGRRGRSQQAFGHAAVTLLLHRQHGGQAWRVDLVVMHDTDDVFQFVMHLAIVGQVGMSALHGRLVDKQLLDFAAVQVGRPDGVWRAHHGHDEVAILLPLPAGLPSQQLGHVFGAHDGVRLQPRLDLVHLGLLVRIQHFQQYAALRTLALQLLQQPLLDLVMAELVMLLADDHARGGGQLGQQLLGAQALAAAQVDDLAQLAHVWRRNGRGGRGGSRASGRCDAAAGAQRQHAGGQDGSEGQGEFHGYGLSGKARIANRYRRAF